MLVKIVCVVEKQTNMEISTSRQDNSGLFLEDTFMENI